MAKQLVMGMADGQMDATKCIVFLGTTRMSEMVLPLLLQDTASHTDSYNFFIIKQLVRGFGRNRKENLLFEPTCAQCMVTSYASLSVWTSPGAFVQLNP